MPVYLVSLHLIVDQDATPTARLVEARTKRDAVRAACNEIYSKLKPQVQVKARFDNAKVKRMRVAS